MRRLRAPNGPDALQRVQLDGVEYQLRWRWVQRASRWSLDVADANGVLLAGGIRVTSLRPLLEGVRSARPNFPPGELFVLDTRRSGRQAPGLDELGSDRFPILYVEGRDR